MKHGKATPPKPDPEKLLLLAGILAPDDEPAAALEKAMRLYVEAVCFCRELPSSFDELVRLYGNESRRLRSMGEPFKKAIDSLKADTLTLDPRATDDPVRQFLADSGWPVKWARSVLHKIREYWAKLPTDAPNVGDFEDYEPLFVSGQRPAPDAFIAYFERSSKDGHKVYEFPRAVLKAVVAFTQRRRRESKRKGWKTRQNNSSV